MRIQVASAVGQPLPRPSPELDSVKNAILGAKTDPELIAVLRAIKGEDEWEEQPDLYDWRDVLDRMDEALEIAMHTTPSLLLIQPTEFPKAPSVSPNSEATEEAFGERGGSGGGAAGTGFAVAAKDRGGSDKAGELVLFCLKFLAILMRNCVNKHIFSSTEHLRTLLAARDDAVAESALRCLMLLTVPPLLHRHQQPELHSMCSIHNDKVVSAELMTLSSGWGGRGQGLGLLACVTGRVEGEQQEMEDNPVRDIPSQTYLQPPVLPASAGDLLFEYTPASEHEASDAAGESGEPWREAGQESNRAPSPGDYTGPRTIYVPVVSGSARESSASMFERLSAKYLVPKRRLFSLLARVRAAVAWRGGLEARRAAVRRRIMALTALVYCHPSQEALMAYVSIQPELIQELVDLVRVRTDASAQSTVPLDISVLAVHCLAALVHTRSGGSNLGLVARHTHVFQELGITRGQYTGLLPLLVRHGVASLFLMPEQDAAAVTTATGAAGGGGTGVGEGDNEAASPRDGGWEESKASDPGDADRASPTRPDAALSLGMAFVEAAGAKAKKTKRDEGSAAMEQFDPAASATAAAAAAVGNTTSGKNGDATVSKRGVSYTALSEMDQLRWVEAVFSLVWAVVSVQHGAAAMTECGLIPALLNVVQLNMDGQGFGGIGRPFHRRYVVSQAVQIMETAVVNNTAALSTFRELGAAEVLASAFSAEIRRLRDADPARGAAAAGDSGLSEDGEGEGTAAAAGVEATAEGEVKRSAGGKAKWKGKGRDKGGAGSKRGAAGSPSSSNATDDDGDGEAVAPLAAPSPSQKALLFSLLNALSITFQNQTQGHQQVGSDPLLEAFLTAAVLDVFRNSAMFGGVLVALTATLISDVANQDPSTTVAYLLRSGIVDAYLKVLTSSPPLPSTDFVVTVPQVLHALCLTHDGASRVQEANVFPSLFRLLRSPDYVHPQTRSPDGNVTNVVGAGLDELMRHVPALRPSCVKSLVAALKEMVAQGDALLQREISGDSSPETLNERYLLQQYAANFGQLVETALGRPENAKPFGDEGGDEVILSMFPLALPGPRPLLARASCCWSHNSQGLANHAAAHSLTSAMKALGLHDTGRLVKRILTELGKELDNLEAARRAILDVGGMSTAVAAAALDGGANVMDVDAQSTPAPSPASFPASRPGGKSSSKDRKGKGKGRGASAAAAAAAAASKAGFADDEDDDVVMSDTIDASRGDPSARDPPRLRQPQEIEGETGGKPSELDVVCLLDCVPREPVYVAWPLSAAGMEAGAEVSGSGSGSDSASLGRHPMPPLVKAFAILLRSLAVTEWLAGALTLLTRWAHSREARSGGGQQGSSSWWGRILLSVDGRRVLERLMKLHRHVLMEVSRARADHHDWLRRLEAAEAGEVDRERRSSLRMPWREPDFYRLLIVAHDGAPVGSSLDSDGSVPAHTLECGTVVVAYERAGNSAGVTRYRTRQGWISETVRGSGREPIAEVIAVGLAGQGEPPEDDVATVSEKRRRLQQNAQIEALLQSSASRHRPVNGLRAAGAGTLARLHTIMKQLTTSFSRVLAGSLPRPHHRGELAQTMNPMAPAACEFLSESLEKGLALGLSKAGFSPSYEREISPEARCTHLAGMLETASSALFDERRQTVNTLLLVRMERRRMPLRLILEACSYIFTVALEMSSGPGAAASPTLAFKGGVKSEGKGEEGCGAGATASAGSVEGTQQAWEAFNRQMDARDRDVSEAATAVASAAGAGTRDRDRELPPPMLEVLKVSLSMLRRLSNRILVLAGPFGPLMQAFPPGHPQRRDWDNALAMAGEPVPPIENPSSAGRHSSASGAAAGVEEEKGETAADREADDDDEHDDGDNDGDSDDGDEGDDGQSPNAAPSSAVAGAGSATAAVDTTPSTHTPMAVEAAAAPDASPGGDRAEGTSGSAGDESTATGTSAVKAGKDKAKEKGKEKAKEPPPPFSADLFLRRVHLLVGGVLEPLWRDPRLPSLPHDAVARLLSAVLETMQTLQSEGSHSSLMRQRQRAQARNQERAASAAAAGRGSSGGGSGTAGLRGGALAANRWNFLSRVREPAATPVPFAPDERTITQLMEMGFTREHVVTALRATETNRVEVAMEYLLTHPQPPPSASVTGGELATIDGTADSAPAPPPAPAAAGVETGGSSTEASAGALDQVADPGASSSAEAEGASSETPAAGDGETRAATVESEIPAVEAAAAAARAAVTESFASYRAAMEASQSTSTQQQQQVNASSASPGDVDAPSRGAASGSVAEGAQMRPPAGSRSGSSRNAGLREIIASLEEMTDSGQQQQQQQELLLRPRPRQVTEGGIPSITAWAGRSSLFPPPLSGSAAVSEAEATGTRATAATASASAAQQQGVRPRTDATLSQVLEEALSRISATSDGDEGGSSAGVSEGVGVESAPDEDVIVEEVEIMQRMEALLTEADGIGPLSGGLPADETGARPVQAGGAGSGEGSGSSGAAVTADAEGFGGDRVRGTDAAAAAVAALAAADSERGTRHGAAATEDMAGSSNSVRAMVEERRSTAIRLRRAIERTIGRAMSASSLPSSAMEATAAEAAASGPSPAPALAPASAASATARDEAAEKEKTAVEKSHQAREEAELKKVCSAIKTLLARFQVSVEEACFRLVAEGDSQGSLGNAGAGALEQQGQGRSRRRSRERSTSSSPRSTSKSFLVANFLSEQARTHRSHRVSDLRGDLLAAQASAVASRGTSASIPAAGGSHAPASTAPGTQESAGGEPDGGGGGGTREGGAASAGSRPIKPTGTGSGAGTSTRSPSSGAALDAASLVFTCISRAEAMLPPLGSTSTGEWAAHPGLAGMLHVLLLLATGVTETQRGALVVTGLHLKLIDLFKATIAAMRREQQQQRRGRQGEPSATVAPAATAAEWPQYLTPCLLLLDLLAKRSNASRNDDTDQKVEDGARNHDRAQHHLRLRRVQHRDQAAERPEASSTQPLLALPPPLSWQRGEREDGAEGTGARAGAGEPCGSGTSSSVPSSTQSQLEGTAPGSGSAGTGATVSGGDSGRGGREERTPQQRQGFQEPADARTTETTSSSSTNPTEGGPPALAESKDGDRGEDGGDARQSSAARQPSTADAQPSNADAGALGGGDAGASASSTSAPSAGPPKLHVLLSPEQMSDLLELFIDFFAGVAVPPPAREAARAEAVAEAGVTEAEKEAALEAEEVGATLPAPSSNLVFASLQLLARLVRDYDRASRFITAGGASSLMALPGSSAFEGSTALLAVVFRHLLEDPATLQSAMETEIRAAFGRLSRSSGTGGRGRGKAGDGRNPPSVRLLPLMSALRPLVLRDGNTLIRAAANVLRRVDAAPDGGGGADGGSGGGAGAGGGSGRTAMVTLTTPFGSAGHHYQQQQQERAHPGASADSEVVAPSLAMLARAASRQRSLGDRRSSAGSAGDRHDRQHGRADAAGSHTTVAGSSAAPHQNRTTIMSLLLSELILRHEGIVRRSNSRGACFAVDANSPTTAAGAGAGTGANGRGEFLGEVNLLELLSDLVLHLPACATSIHRFGQRERSWSHGARLLAPTPGDAVAPRPGSAAAVARAIRVLQAQRHAVSGSEPPSPNVVAFLLHEQLPSPRAGDTAAKGIVDAEERRKRKALSALQGRKAQAAGRLLLALCARAGEGRRRVLAELYSALTCHPEADGVSNNTRRPGSRGRRTDTEMWALQAWGELALGLAAPRATASNEYGNQTLAWDVVRAVTDLGAVYALTRALSRMDLNHSRAPSCGAALVRPLEMFTRASVAESLRCMKAKDDGRGAAADTGVQSRTAAATSTPPPSTVSTVAGAEATTPGAGAASGTAGAGASTPNRRSRGRRRESRGPGGVVGGATPASGEGGGGGSSSTGARTPGRARGSSSRSSSRRRTSSIFRALTMGGGDGIGLGTGSISGGGRSGGVEGDGDERRGSGPGTSGAAGTVSTEASRSRATGAIGRGGAGGGRARTSLQELRQGSEIGLQSFADDDVMLDEAFGGQPEARRDEMLVEVDLSAIVADMEHGDGAEGGDHHDDDQVLVPYGSQDSYEMDDHEASEMLHAAPSNGGGGAGGGRSGRRSNRHGIGNIDLEDRAEEEGEEEEDAGGLGRHGHGEEEEEEEEDDDDDDDDDDEDEDDNDDGDGDGGGGHGDDAEDSNVVGQGVNADAMEEDEDEEEEDGDGEDEEEEEDEEELGEDEIDLDGHHGDEGGVYVLGGDEEIPVELDWGAEDMFEPPDLATIYAQVGWDGTGGAQRAGGGRSGTHRFLPGGGGGRGRDGGGGGWIPGDGIQEHLHVWGGQPPPGLARQYATTRVGDRGIGMNVISWNDFIESVESDSALSQMLRSVPGGGGGGPPFVRVVRGQGADGRWTEMITQDMHAVPSGPSPNTTRLFPDGPSAATQAHAAAVVHPLLLAHARHGGGGGSSGAGGGSGAGGSSRSSGRRSSRMAGGGGGGGGGASSRHHAALGLLTHERLIWDGHVGGGTAGGPPALEHTMMDALEGLNLVVNQPGVGRNGSDPSVGASRRLQGATAAGAGGPGAPVANEGRWTDNGQPLTAAEGRTVLPILEQVEQAIVTRLLPSQAALDRAQAASEHSTSAGAEAKDEEKEEQEEKDSKEEQRDPSTPATSTPMETAARGARSSGDGLGTTAVTPHSPRGPLETPSESDGGGVSSLEASAARDSVVAVVERAVESVPTAGNRGAGLEIGGGGAGGAAATVEEATAAGTPAAAAATPMAVEDSASVSEGEAVAVLASSLSLSPSREAAEVATATAAAPAEASARPDEQTPATQEAPAATQGTTMAETAEEIPAADVEAGSALAALLHGADQYVAAVEAMDVVDEGNGVGDGGVEESKRDEGEGLDDMLQEGEAEVDAAEEDDDEEDKENEDGEEEEEEELDEGQEEDEEEEEVGGIEEAATGEGAAAGDGAGTTGADTAIVAGAAVGGEMVCPPGMDPEVFAQLPLDMQQEVIREHRNTVGSMEDQAELLEAAGLDPEALAALPPEMRREVLEQEARNRRIREAANAPPADPSRAADMDNASFVATLPPELRREVLLSADEALLNTLPPGLLAEAMMMRERVPHQAEFHAAAQAQAAGYASGPRADGGGGGSSGGGGGGSGSRAAVFGVRARRASGAGSGAGSGQRAAEAAKDDHDGELRLEAELKGSHNSPPPVPRETLAMIIRLLYLLSPIRPLRLLQRTALNLCTCHPVVRRAVVQSLVHLIKSDSRRLRLALKALPRAIDGPRGTTTRQQQRQQQQRRKQQRLKLKVSDGGKGGGDGSSEDSDSEIDEGKGAAGGGGPDGGGQPDAGPVLGVGPWSEDEDFPPRRLLGPASDSTPQPTFAAAAGTSVGGNGGSTGAGETGAGGGRGVGVHEIHPMVARRGRDFLHYLCKTSSRVRYEMLTTGPADEDEGVDGGGEGREPPLAAMTGSLGETPFSGKSKGKGKKVAHAAQHNKGKGKMVIEAMDVGDDHDHPNVPRAVETEGASAGVLLEQLMDLLDRPLYTMSGPDLEELLQLIEVLVAPLEDLKQDQEKPAEPTASAGAGDGVPTRSDGSINGAQSGAAAERGSEMEVDSPPAETATGASEAAAASAAGPSEKYEWVKLPAPVVRTDRLRLLCSVLRLEACSDSSFQRVGKVVSNLSKVPQNRSTLLNELVSVAKSLGTMSTQDLQTLGQELDVVKRDVIARAAQSKGDKEMPSPQIPKGKGKAPSEASATGNRGSSSSSGTRGAMSPIVVNLNSSSNELKLLRVLQTLINLTGKDSDTLDNQLDALELDGLWEALSSCLAVVSVLEGVADEEDFLDETALQGGSSGGGSAASSGGARGGVVGTPSGRRSTTAESGGARRGGSAADPAESGAQTAKRTSAMAGLVARFLPVVEAFFVANAREPRGADPPNEEEVAPAVGDGTPAAEGAQDGGAGREQMEEDENDADGPSPAAAAEQGAGSSAPTTESSGPSVPEVSPPAAATATAAAIATAARSSAPADSASAAGSQPADQAAASAETAPAAATETETETAPVTATEASGETTTSDGAGASGSAGEDRGSGRVVRRESVHRVTTMPGARFRKNVPRNMRPLVEAEDDKAATPESLRLSRFVARHKSLLNALLHQNPTLLEKSLSAMVYSPRCRQHLDFENKRAFFRSQLRRLRQHSTRRYGSLRLTVPRSQVFEYSFHQLRVRNAEEMRGRLHITFQNEDGIDAGGLTREWYSILARDIFNQNYALFIAAADGATFQPNPVSHVNSDHLAYFKFVGRIVGKAIADGQALDAHFTQSFYKHILGVTVTHQDMQAIDPDYYKNLLQITTLPLEDLGLDLTFSTDTEMFGRHEVVDLVPDGRNIMVTDENKLEYVQRITHHRMTHSIREQIEAFLEGFHDLVPPELISIFTPKELELLISGLPDVDLDDLQNNTEYTNFKSTDKEIQWFWNVLRSFSREDLALFLQYVTGTSKVPLGGFSLLQGMRGIQKFNIHKAFGGSHLLPAAHTCFNQLDLPKYTSEEMTRERTLLAIHEGSEGFGFG